MGALMPAQQGACNRSAPFLQPLSTRLATIQHPAQDRSAPGLALPGKVLTSQTAPLHARRNVLISQKTNFFKKTFRS